MKIRDIFVRRLSCKDQTIGMGMKTNMMSVTMVMATREDQYLPTEDYIEAGDEQVFISPIAVNVVMEKHCAVVLKAKFQLASGGTQLNIRVPAHEIVKAIRKAVFIS